MEPYSKLYLYTVLKPINLILFTIDYYIILLERYTCLIGAYIDRIDGTPHDS